MPNWEFGMRCTEDMGGDLWIGKVGVTRFEEVFDEETISKVKNALKSKRGLRRGAFWFKPKEKVIIMADNDSLDTGDYPSVSLDQNE